MTTDQVWRCSVSYVDIILVLNNLIAVSRFQPMWTRRDGGGAEQPGAVREVANTQHRAAAKIPIDVEVQR